MWGHFSVPVYGYGITIYLRMSSPYFGLFMCCLCSGETEESSIDQEYDKGDYTADEREESNRCRSRKKRNPFDGAFAQAGSRGDPV